MIEKKEEISEYKIYLLSSKSSWLNFFYYNNCNYIRSCKFFSCRREREMIPKCKTTTKSNFINYVNEILLNCLY